MKKIITLFLLGILLQISSSFSQKVIEAEKVIQEYAEKPTVLVETVAARHDIKVVRRSCHFNRLLF